MTRVFVTGASGFIGGALATRLLEGGDEVVGLARSEEAAAVVARRGTEVARGNLLHEDSLVAGMEGCALAYHVAGVSTHCPSDPAMLLRVNVEGAEAAVRAAAALTPEQPAPASALRPRPYRPSTQRAAGWDRPRASCPGWRWPRAPRRRRARLARTPPHCFGAQGQSSGRRSDRIRIKVKRPCRAGA